MNGAELSHALRGGATPHLARRRRVFALSLFSSGAMGVVALYQLGILRRLPDPPLPGFDSERVDASSEAYEILSSPDAVLGLGGYAATMALAAADGPDRAVERPWLPLALLVKVAADAAVSGKLTVDQWTKHRAFCAWCLAAAAATFATVPYAVPEALDAWRQLRRRRRNAGTSLIRIPSLRIDRPAARLPRSAS